MIDNNSISPEWRLQGLKLEDTSDDAVVLKCGNQVLARFSPSGVTPENLLKVSEETVQGREN